jgi:hypothetical protein
MDKHHFIWINHILSSVEDATTYIGVEVKHNPVESPSRTGILSSVDKDGYCIIDDCYVAPYWQIRVYAKQYFN